VAYFFGPPCILIVFVNFTTVYITMPSRERHINLLWQCINTFSIQEHTDLVIRAVRHRRRRAADILLTPPPPIITDRRAAAADAADRMSASRRRRLRGVHVTLYTSYMLLDFCNAVYNESSTLTKSSKNDAGVFCNSPWYSNKTQRRNSKSVFVDNFVKMKADAKSFV